MVPGEERSNRQLTRPSKEVADMAFQMFWSAMAPLREAGKLGMVAFQFPPYFIPKLGITPEVRYDHATYLASWLAVLKQDKRAIFAAASQAHRAADYLCGLQPRFDPESA